MEGASHVGAGTCLLSLAMMGASPKYYTPSLVLIILAFVFQGLQSAGSLVNPTDLAPVFSGMLFGVMNTIGALAGLLQAHSCTAISTGMGMEFGGHKMRSYVNVDCANLRMLPSILIIDMVICRGTICHVL